MVMKIGIDISQIVHEGTGVANYVRKLVAALTKIDRQNEYVLFGSSLRKRFIFEQYFLAIKEKNVRLVTIPIPPTILDILWNKWHVAPIEWITGPIDIFWSSDWTQPPLVKGIGVTTVHDVSFLRYPETFAKQIIDVHKRRLERVRSTCRMILCDSQATKKDLIELLNFPEKKLQVVYPGL